MDETYLVMKQALDAIFDRMRDKNSMRWDDLNMRPKDNDEPLVKNLVRAKASLDNIANGAEPRELQESAFRIAFRKVERILDEPGWA